MNEQMNGFFKYHFKFYLLCEVFSTTSPSPLGGALGLILPLELVQSSIIANP